MWFERSTRNRRFRRENVLDVKLRSNQVRAARIRVITLLLAIAVGTVTTFFVIWRGGEWALQRFVYENDAFAIKAIDVRTDGVVALEQLRKWAGVKPGDNLLALDLGRVKRDLELVPFIKSADVERVLPRTLRLRITERQPVAQVFAFRARAQGGGAESILYLFDGEGYVMLPLPEALRSESGGAGTEAYPILTGVNGNDLRLGHPAESPQVRAALRLISEFENSPMAGLVDLTHIDVSELEILKVTTRQGSEITFGLSRLDRQLSRWRTIHDAAFKQGAGIATLDLSVTNNLPVRWTDLSATPPTAKPVKPIRQRKKNV